MLFPPLLEAAARLAAQGHYHHFRKREPGDTCCEENSGDTLPADCVPYITHLMGTMGILARSWSLCLGCCRHSIRHRPSSRLPEVARFKAQ